MGREKLESYLIEIEKDIEFKDPMFTKNFMSEVLSYTASFNDPDYTDSELDAFEKTLKDAFVSGVTVNNMDLALARKSMRRLASQFFELHQERDAMRKEAKRLLRTARRRQKKS